MFVSVANAYGPKQIAALQTVFESVWLEVSDAYVISRDDLAKLIIVLAADGGADDSEEIDVHDMTLEAMQILARMQQRVAWARPRRIPVSSPDYFSD